MSPQPDFRAMHDGLVAEMIAKGKLLEAGFLGVRMLLPQDIAPEQLAQLRLAYLGGAQHVWASMFAAMSPDREPTMQDMRRMALISAELHAAGAELKALSDQVNAQRGH